MPPRQHPGPTVLLVVDDEPSVLEIARRILEPAGYQVLRAGNGPEAITLLAAGTPLDLLIADLRMPGMGGAEMVRLIRTTRPNLKVLYVTGLIDTLLDGRSLSDHEAFLGKPFTLKSLRDAVSLILYGTLTKSLAGC